MTTVKIGSARILMSSWEVTAFVTEDGPSAEDLRRAVVARALVTTATESAKETGNATGLDRALSGRAYRSLSLAGTRGRRQAGKRYRSGRESGHQHQTVAFRVRRSRETLASAHWSCRDV